jgi:hypothetical protein
VKFHHLVDHITAGTLTARRLGPVVDPDDCG